MQLANQVDGVHLDVEIKASRSPPGAASDAFLGGGGEFHARLPARVCGARNRARHASRGHRLPHRTSLLADAAPVARGRRRAASQLRRSLHATLLDAAVASTPRCWTPQQPSRPASLLRATPLDAAAVGVPCR